MNEESWADLWMRFCAETWSWPYSCKGNVEAYFSDLVFNSASLQRQQAQTSVKVEPLL